jgi:hypothetical protein
MSTTQAQDDEDKFLAQALGDALAELLNEVLEEEICFDSSDSARALRLIAEELDKAPLPMRGGDQPADFEQDGFGDENAPEQAAPTQRGSGGGSSSSTCKEDSQSQGPNRYQNVGSCHACMRVAQNRTAKLLAAISTRSDGMQEVRQDITSLLVLIKRDCQLLVSVCFKYGEACASNDKMKATNCVCIEMHAKLALDLLLSNLRVCRSSMH